MPDKAVFLDRDGVINKVVYRYGKPTSPRNMAEFEFEEGIEQSLDRLRHAGFRLFVVTNQPELARGLLTIRSLNLMTNCIRAKLRIDAVRICPHDDSYGCKYRKPQPGMLIELTQKYDLCLENSYIIGDTWRDSLAGKNAGCGSLILDRPYNSADPADWRVPHLSSAVDLICTL